MSHNFLLEAALLLIMIINCVTEPFYDSEEKTRTEKVIGILTSKISCTDSFIYYYQLMSDGE